jgi:hypothetical protein
VDTTAQGWSGIDQVQIWSGSMDNGGQEVAQAVIQMDRPDVAAALNNPFWTPSGYAANVTLSSFGPGSTLYVYAHTPSKGWWYQTVLVTEPIGGLSPRPRLDIEEPTPLGTVHSTQPFTIHGSAYDPAAAPGQGSGVDRVQVYLGGDRKSGIFIGDGTLGSFDKFVAAAAGPQFANSGWQLTFQPNSWLDSITDNQVTQLTVYAHSSVTGQESEDDTSIVISVP